MEGNSSPRCTDQVSSPVVDGPADSETNKDIVCPDKAYVHAAGATFSITLEEVGVD